ncbi:hypothetical protein PR048_024923 [Dryococelus australis]|uniref:Uncharacterized protein n=1 Tax=Dryococelus australis TaxID=614101 RepID=A0ABQ9GPW0_9NEOP|nr:hypothetical protein PR048_024923 [Dryococelus australis]
MKREKRSRELELNALYITTEGSTECEEITKKQVYFAKIFMAILDFDILRPQPQLPLVTGRLSTWEDMFLSDMGQPELKVEQGNSKTSITVMFSFSASGLMVLPMLPIKIVQSVKNSWKTGCIDTDWMKAEVFYEYIGNIFVPFVMPPTQEGWKEGALDWRRELANDDLNNRKFCPVLRTILNKDVEAEALQNGFVRSFTTAVQTWTTRRRALTVPTAWKVPELAAHFRELTRFGELARWVTSSSAGSEPAWRSVIDVFKLRTLTGESGRQRLRQTVDNKQEADIGPCKAYHGARPDASQTRGTPSDVSQWLTSEEAARGVCLDHRLNARHMVGSRGTGDDMATPAVNAAKSLWPRHFRMLVERTGVCVTSDIVLAVMVPSIHTSYLLAILTK